jgi:hypothetical protein
MVQATDPDAGTLFEFQILNGNTDNAFAINGLTGALTVNNSQALSILDNPAFILLVKVTDNGLLCDSAYIGIQLIPGSNTSPVINNQQFTISELIENGEIAGTVIATDPDGGQLLDYQIISGNESNIFVIDAETGEISINDNSLINYELTNQFILGVSVTDNALPPLTCTAVITILVANEPENPVVEAGFVSIQEHLPEGTSVFYVTASDEDAGSSLVFSIPSGNFLNAFKIDSQTGEIIINNPLAVCYENHPQFNLTIRATDQDGKWGENIISIQVTDVNEPPQCNDQLFVLNENTPQQTRVGSINYSDPDFGQLHSFTIIGGNYRDAFIINPQNGEIWVNNVSAIDYELNSSIPITILITDNGSGTLTDTAEILCTIIDVNEAPVIDNQYFSLSSAATIGTVAGVVTAFDPDLPGGISYSLIEGNTANTFEINSETGVISVLNTDYLQGMAGSSYQLMVKVTDHSADSLTATGIVAISIVTESSAQIIYINPDNLNDPLEDGTIAHPYDSWQDATITSGNTYLQKRGTFYKQDLPVSIVKKRNITIGAYDSGEKPVIYTAVSGNNSIEIEDCESIHVSDIEFFTDENALAAVSISEGMSEEISLNNLKISGYFTGIDASAHVKGLKVFESEISEIKTDGIKASQVESIEIAGCRIESINRLWHTNPVATGSCIILKGIEGQAYIHDNYLDHSLTGNMAALRIEGTLFSGIIERNTIIGNKWALNHCVSLTNQTGEFIVRYNSFDNGASGINVNALNTHVYYNQFTRNTIAVKVQSDKFSSLLNNTFVENTEAAIESFINSKVLIKNNIFYLSHSATKAYKLSGTFESDFNNFNLEKNSFLNGYSTLASWQKAFGQDVHSFIKDPGFEDITSGAFKLKPNSSCINKGCELNLTTDFFGTQVPQAGIPDIGYCEANADVIKPGEEEIPVSPQYKIITADFYPNPTPGDVNIKFENAENQDLELRIFDMKGYQIYSRVCNQNDLETIKLGDLSSGTYTAVVTINGQKISQNIIRK